jgi:hypothetical protein
MLPKAAQVVDPFDVISPADRSLHAVRPRVQNEQTGRRGRKDDLLYRVRRVLLGGEEKRHFGPRRARRTMAPCRFGRSKCITGQPSKSTTSTRSAEAFPRSDAFHRTDGQLAPEV